MKQNLVFITGGSSGIGLALARAVPFADARVVTISRRGATGLVHHPADLADPASWPGVASLFEREVASNSFERVVLVHSAGTLTPIGFAGSVDPVAYARNAILNSAAPQVIGDAFLRATRRTRAARQLLMISSGAAHSVYPGWSSYCAGKAAVDQWVRTAGAEQARLEHGCRILAVAPGVVETAMQEEIRASAAADFPDVERFLALHAQGELRRPEAVARELWALLERDLENGAVIDLREVAS